jgi:hypothetical protein
VYEVYRELHAIVAWSGGAIGRTEYIEEGWYPQHAVNSNRPTKTLHVYLNVPGDHPMARKPTIRKA